jgi:ABC-type uncharacterized transport system ATPase subunit
MKKFMKVELREITKVFGPVRANDNISYTFQPGRIYAILGENGAGKSTLMKILSGFQLQTSGEILIDGRPADIDSPNRAIEYGIGMLYQDPQDFAPLTVLENYMFGRGGDLLLSRREARQDLLNRCKELGFALNPGATVESLTVGERQQLEIARLLSLGVEVLILDEPTTGISADQRAQLFSTLQDLAHEDDMTVLLVTHKFRDVEELCDELIVLRKGELVGSAGMPCSTDTMVEMMFGKRLEGEPPPLVEKGTEILSIEDLDVDARLFTIDDIDLDIHEGEVIGLAGLDGSGQVDFMRTIAGLDRPTLYDNIFSLRTLVLLWIIFALLLNNSPTVMWMMIGAVTVLILVPMIYDFLIYRVIKTGAVEYLGQQTYGRGYRDLLSKGMVFLPSGRLEEGLVSGLTVTQHFALSDRSWRPWVNWFEAQTEAREGIETYDVRGRPGDPIQALSGGNQQRVALAMLPERARVLLLDNPTRGLDVESARHIWALLLERREQGTSIIFSSPDLDEILDYSDRVLVFSSGKVTLVDDPSHLTTARLGELIGGKS